jgi:cytochrome b subunit of formate dehydrogenase
LTHTTNPALVIGIAVFIAGFSLVHLARRWRQLRGRVDLSEDVTFSKMQRAMHWTIGPGCAALLLTGLPVYLAQFSVNPPVPTPLNFFYWGYQVALWRTAHIYLALAVVAAVLIHSGWDAFRVKSSAKIARVSRGDFREAWRRGLDFLGFSKQPSPRPTPKYDFFHKAFHWTLIALGAFLLVSGLVEWEAIRVNGVPVFVLLDRFNNTLMDGFLRTGHLVAAMLFAGLVALHVYFAVLPQNRPLLRAMSLGSSRSHPPPSLRPESSARHPRRDVPAPPANQSAPSSSC